MDPYRELLSDSGSVYFAHADLNITDIMILRSPTGTTVFGIIDWEQCGWYPEYWEYCRMHLSNSFRHEWRAEGYVERSLQSYDNELAVMFEYWQWPCP
jgi:hypothetical protein